MTVDEDKVATIKKVFELKAIMSDASLQKIAGVLNSEGHTYKRRQAILPYAGEKDLG